MTLKNKNIKKGLKKVQKFSSLVEKKLSTFNQAEQRIEKFTFEELSDLNNLLHAADYILCKYEDKKEVHSLLKEFVDMINNSTMSTDLLNDEISELVVSAESTIAKIKNLQSDVSENFSLNTPTNEINGNDLDMVPENSTNNLTKSITHVYTQEYLDKSEVKIGQII